MKNVNHESNQRGIALILSLLLLLIMTIVGVAAMSGTNLQQRMAGNAYLQAQAFEAASAGVANAIAFRDAFWPEGRTCNASTAAEWMEPWVNMGEIGGARLRQRMYCLEFSNDDENGAASGHELFILNRGEVLAGDQVVSVRDVEVRIGRFGEPPGPICQSVAMCFPIHPDLDIGDCDPSSSEFCNCIGNINPFSGFNSNAFTVVGQEYDDFGHGPAMALPPHYMLAFECAVTGGQTAEQCEAGGNQGRCARLGNYIDSIVSAPEFGEPWDDPNDTFEFANVLRNYAMSEPNGEHVAPGHPDWGTINYQGGPNWLGANWGGGKNLGNDTVTYVDGDALLGGNVTGSGILVIEGKMKWNGTPQFDGLIIALGGVFDVSGGGTGGDGAGSLVVVDLEPKPSQLELYTCQQGDDFCIEGEELLLSCADHPDCSPDWGGEFDITFRGGGKAEYAFGCQELWDSWEQLTPEVQDMWEPNCNPEGGAPPIGVIEGIASWRENIGWRTEDFPGGQD